MKKKQQDEETVPRKRLAVKKMKQKQHEETVLRKTLAVENKDGATRGDFS